MIEKVLTEDSALYRGTRFFLSQGRKLWDKPFLFTPAVFGLAIAVSASGLLDGIRPFFLLYLIVAIVISVNLKNAFLGFFLTFLFTLQFVHPNKGYSIEVIRGDEILEPFFHDGYSIGYFFHLPTFFFVLSGGTFVREFLSRRKSIPHGLLSTMGLLGGVWVLFSIAAMYGITRFSPYVFLSSVWLLQYGMMYYVAMGICFGLAMFKEFKPLLFSTLAMLIGTQVFVCIFQLYFQRSAGFHFEAESLGTYSTGLDENNAVFRVMGSFMFHNQLAYIVGLLTAAVLPLGLEKKSLFYVSMGFLGLFVVVLTQSRTALIGVALTTLITAWVYRKNLHSIVQKFGARRLFFYVLIAFLMSSFGIIPRILLSVNAGYDGAGLSIRIRMVNEAVEAIAGSPLIGYGIATNEYVLHNLFPNGVMSVFPAVVHLAYLQLWLEIGLIGLVLFLLPLLWLGRFCLVHLSDTASKHIPLACINGILISLIFWALLPHIGIIEFPFLGITLGLGSYWYYLSRSKARGT